MSLTPDEIQVRNDAIDKCGCLCHEQEMLHFMPCCEYTYQHKVKLEVNEDESHE